MRFFSRGRDDSLPSVDIMFLCVENAGRSQMAAAFAERERSKRNLEDWVEIHSAGTRPASAVNETTIQALAEMGIDISDRVPTVVQLEELKEMDIVVMMGCYVAEFNPTTFGSEVRDWSLPNPQGADFDTVRRIRDAIDARVVDLFDELEQR